MWVQKAVRELAAMLAVEDVTDRVTINESGIANKEFWRIGNMLFGYFQGATKTHATGATLFTLPDDLAYGIIGIIARKGVAVCG